MPVENTRKVSSNLGCKNKNNVMSENQVDVLIPEVIHVYPGQTLCSNLSLDSGVQLLRSVKIFRVWPFENVRSLFGGWHSC